MWDVTPAVVEDIRQWSIESPVPAVDKKITTVIFYTQLKRVV